MSLWPLPTLVAYTRQTIQTPSSLSPVAVAARARAGLTLHHGLCILAPELRPRDPGGSQGGPGPPAQLLPLSPPAIWLASGLGAFRCVRATLLQSCRTLCDPMDHSPPASSVRGILQARILEWVDISSSGDLPHPGIEPTSLPSPALAGGFFTTSATGAN